MPLPRGNLDEFGLSASKRLEEEQKQRRELARKKRAEEEEAKRRAAQAEKVLQAAAEARRAEEARKRQAEARIVAIEARRTGGIQWITELRAVPVASQGDRIELPESALIALEQLGALDEQGGPLFFELCLQDSSLDYDIETQQQDQEEEEDEVQTNFYIRKDATYASVREFKANEGQIGLPPKTMLSLTRGNPEIASRLEQGQVLVRVQYVKLPAPNKSRAALRPLADGFFIHDQQDQIQIDLKRILEDELRLHAALTRGDWLAVDLDSHTVRLRVDELSPHAAMSVIHTDLEIELLPSEKVQAQADQAKAHESHRALRQAQRLEAKKDAQKQFERLIQITSSAPHTQKKIRIQVRFRDGTKIETALLESIPATSLTTLVDAHRPDALEADWLLVSSYPRRTISRQELNSGTLSDVAHGATSLALLVQDIQEDDKMNFVKEEKTEEEELWRSAKSFAEAEEKRKAIKKEFPSSNITENTEAHQVTGAGKAHAFGKLLAAGVTDRVKAAHSAQNYAHQILELDSMGLLDKDADLILNLLDRYGGRLLRVVNALSDALEKKQSSMDIDNTPIKSSSPPPQIDQQALIAEHFRRLVATGTLPNAAAAQALVLAADPRLQLYSHQRQDLKAMGFDDISPTTLDLLDRFNGRIDDVAIAFLEQEGASSS